MGSACFICSLECVCLRSGHCKLILSDTQQIWFASHCEYLLNYTWHSRIKSSFSLGLCLDVHGNFNFSLHDCYVASGLSYGLSKVILNIWEIVVFTMPGTRYDMYT